MLRKEYLLCRIIELEDVQDEMLDTIDQLQTIVSHLDDEIRKLQKPAKKTGKKGK